MNKYECIKYCENAIKEMWEKYGKPADYTHRRAVYEHCKDFCKNNGYTAVYFRTVWNLAVNNVHHCK